MFCKLTTPHRKMIRSAYRGVLLQLLVITMIGINFNSVNATDLMYVAIGGNSNNLPPNGFLLHLMFHSIARVL